MKRVGRASFNTNRSSTNSFLIQTSSPSFFSIFSSFYFSFSSTFSSSSTSSSSSSSFTSSQPCYKIQAHWASLSTERSSTCFFFPKLVLLLLPLLLMLFLLLLSCFSSSSFSASFSFSILKVIEKYPTKVVLASKVP